MNTVRELLNRMTAMLIIIVMIIAQFAIIGQTLVSYAIDRIATSNENVEILAYFEDSNGEKVTEIEKEIDKTLILKVDVAVKNEGGYGGYFDGNINLGNTNFELVDNSEISVHVNAGETKTIEREIKYANTLEETSAITLQGKYVNSQGEYSVEGATEVKVKWLSSEDVSAELSLELLTNSTYTIEGESKRIIQFLVTSNVKDNSYAVKSTQVEITMPDGVLDAKVFKREADGVLGYIGDETLDKLTIKLENAELVWPKSAKDVVVVTYELDNSVDIQQINAVGKLTLYDDKEITTEEQSMTIQNTIDGSVTGEIAEEEAEIYKGKIYTGEARTYQSTTKAYVNYEKAADGIEIVEEKAKYGTNEANIQYVETVVNIDKLVSVLGTEGNLKIEDNSGNEIANITRETEHDSESNVVIAYPEGITSIRVTTSKPQNNGTLNLIHKKKIQETGYTREEIEGFTNITEKIIINTKEVEKTIELKETESEVKALLENDVISTISDEEKHLRIGLKLNTEDESKELYKNPSIKITLPKEITGLSVEEVSALYTNGLERKPATANRNANGECEVELIFEGEQTEYDTTGGTEIVIDLNVVVNKLTPSKTSNLKIEYTNENKNVTKEANVDLKFESEYGLMLYNKVSNFNNSGDKIETISSETISGKLDMNSESINSEVKTVLINNYGETVENITLIGKIPEEENSTFNSILENVTVNNSQATIYYSNNIDADIEDSSWTSEKIDAVAYKIEIPSIEGAETITTTATIKIPENLEYNQKGYIKEKVRYNYHGQAQEKNADILLKTEEKIINNGGTSTGEHTVIREIAPGITASIATTSGNKELKEGDSIYEGQTVKYTITITNNSGTDYENVSVKATQTNGKVWDYVIIDGYNYFYNRETHEHYYMLTDNNEIDLGTIENLKNGESASIEYQSSANTLEESNGTDAYGTINISIDSSTQLGEFETIKNTIQEGKIKMALRSINSEELISAEGGVVESLLEVTNISDEDLTNVKIEVALSPYLEITEGKEEYFFNIEEGKENLLNIQSVENNSEGETIVVLGIEKILKGEKIGLFIDAKAKKLNIGTENETIEILAKSEIETNTYYSNKFIRNIYSTKNNIEFDVNAFMKEAKISGDTTIKDGEIITLVSSIKNNEAKNITVKISESFKDGQEFKYATLIKSGSETDISSDFSGNVFETLQEIEANSSIQIKIYIQINKKYLQDSSTDMNVELVDEEYINVYTKSITIETDKFKDENDNGNENQDQDQNQNTEDNTTSGNTVTEQNTVSDENVISDENTINGGQTTEEETKYYTVKGTIWVDENENGKRETNEKKVENVTIRAINFETGKVIENTEDTTKDGTYSLKVEKGKYIILFIYDTDKYLITKYQTSGIATNLNSDGITRKIKSGNNEITVGATDILNIENDIENIDLGLINKKSFNLRLDKYISKVIVTNGKGTTTYEQKDKTTLAKVEIPSKYLNGTNVVIEYKLKVTNIGDIAGYANRIVDYIPQTLNFSTNLNKEWYKSGEYIYNVSLTNSKIEPGETKEIDLILTKAMTSSNTGLVNNQAEIELSSNDYGVEDKTKEKGSADVLLLISTGSAISYTITVLTIIVSILGTAYLINRKFLKDDEV